MTIQPYPDDPHAALRAAERDIKHWIKVLAGAGVSDMDALLFARCIGIAGRVREAAREILPDQHTGRFELRRDEDTGRLYWWGGEDGWKDPTEIGEDGVLTLDAQHFAVGTVLKMTEPVECDRRLAREQIAKEATNERAAI